MKLTVFTKYIAVAFFVYLSLFGIALFVSGFLRSAAPFYRDVFIEISFALIGAMFVFGGVKGVLYIIKTKNITIDKNKIKLFIISIAIAILIYIFSIFGLFSFLPSIVQLVVTSGFQIGFFLLSVIESVISGRFGLWRFREFFILIPWLFHVFLIYIILTWIWSKKKV